MKSKIEDEVLKRKLKGIPKSGRIWKRDHHRKSDLIDVKPLHTSWSTKIAKRSEKKNMKAFEQELKDEKIKAKEEKRYRTEENKRRREENAKKSEIVQKITNTKKLKRLKKKQMRAIQKR